MRSSDRVLKAARSPEAHPAAPEAAGEAAGARLLGTGRVGARSHKQAPPAPSAAQSATAADGGADLTEEIRRVIREAERRGYESGRSRAEAELSAAVTAAGSMATLLEDAVPRQAPVLAALLAELAIAVAARILDAEVTLDPALLRGALERAMEGVNGSPEVRVLLHPRAVDPVREAWFAAHGTAFAGKRWIFDADPALPAGGCVVRHDHGFVDAGLDAQLAEVSAAMDKVVPLVGRAREAAA